MKRIKALCDMWVAVVWTGKETLITVSIGIDRPPHWLQEDCFQLKANEGISFDNVSMGAIDPYQAMVDEFPKCFVLEEEC